MAATKSTGKAAALEQMQAAYEQVAIASAGCAVATLSRKDDSLRQIRVLQQRYDAETALLKRTANNPLPMSPPRRRLHSSKPRWSNSSSRAWPKCKGVWLRLKPIATG
jgi:hypothetical protein